MSQESEQLKGRSLCTVGSGVEERFQIEFYDGEETTVWIDTEKYMECSADMETYLKEIGVDEDVAIAYSALGFKVLRTNGSLTGLTYQDSNSFNDEDSWDFVQDLLNQYPLEALEASQELGLPLSEFEDKYLGTWESNAKHAEDYYYEFEPEYLNALPNEIKVSIDWDNVYDQYLRHSENICDGYYFLC